LQRLKLLPLLHPVYYFKNNSIDPSAQHLLVQNGAGFIGFVLFDSSEKQVHAWVLYQTKTPLNEDLLSEIIQQQEWLVSSFRSVTIADYSELNTLVPKSLFVRGNEKVFTSILPGNHHHTVSLEDSAGEAINLYQIASSSYVALSRRFPHAIWMHHETTVLQRPPTEESKIIVELWFHQLLIFASQKGKWLLLQQRSYQAPEDVLYHVLNCKQQFEMGEEVAVTLQGMVEENSALYKLLHQYIINLELDNQLVYEYPQNTADIPSHTKQLIDRILTCVS
jgi:hypothetical protein